MSAATGPAGGGDRLDAGGDRFDAWLGRGLALLLVALLALHAAAIATESFHWDEFALFARVRASVDGDRLHGGGRPGLAVLLLMPLVEGCRDEIATLLAARGAWTAVTALFVLGWFVLLRQACRRSGRPATGAALGVALLVLVPVFLRWSLQVRTDPPALACAAWAGVALLASRRRPALAAAAGALFGAGFLITQKVAYVAALVLLLGLADLTAERIDRRAVRGLLLRAAGCAAGAGAVALAYRAVVARALVAPPLLDVAGGLRIFDFYRTFVGYDAYLKMLPTLAPHLGWIGLLVAATAAALAGRIAARREVVLAWAILALGAAVCVFHRGRFPYFWMTLGLFPATAAAVAVEPVAELLGDRRRLRAVVALSLLVLAIPGTRAAAALLADTQAIQRESLAFVDRSFPRATHGFQADGALFCRADPEPLPVFLGAEIYRRFGGPDARRETDLLLARLRERPVDFIVRSEHLLWLPPEILELWDRHYRLYRAAVMIPARELAGGEGAAVPFDLLVGGTYRWRAARKAAGVAGTPVAIDGRPVADGEAIDLAAGPHRAELRSTSAASAGAPDAAATPGAVRGVLVLAVADRPAPSAEPFYSPAMSDEM
jgi:hypothetical protein